MCSFVCVCHGWWFSPGTACIGDGMHVTACMLAGRGCHDAVNASASIPRFKTFGDLDPTIYRLYTCMRYRIVHFTIDTWYIYNMSYHIVFVAFRKKWETARSGGELFGRVQKLLNSVDLWSILYICDHLWSILMWSCNWIRIIRLHLLQSVYLKIFEEMQWPANFREVAKKGEFHSKYSVSGVPCLKRVLFCCLQGWNVSRNKPRQMQLLGSVDCHLLKDLSMKPTAKARQMLLAVNYIHGDLAKQWHELATGLSAKWLQRLSGSFCDRYRCGTSWY